MKLSFAVDWISMTMPRILGNSFFPDFSFGYEEGRWLPAAPKNGYTHAIKHPYGMVLMWSEKRVDMGYHMMISGRALRELENHGMDGLQILKWARDRQVPVTRIDLAIDVKDQEIDIPSLVRSEQHKAASGRKKKIGITQEVGGGCTAYVGSRTSDKFMRVYDKASEQGLPAGNHWTRFEMEIKGKTARGVANLLAGKTPKEAYLYTKGVMKGHFNPMHETYERIMKGDAIFVSSEKNVDHDRINWLMGVVAKSMAKTINENPHIDVWTLFQDRVGEELKGLGWG